MTALQLFARQQSDPTNGLINLDSETRFPVSGRELHAKLEVSTPYHIWFPRMCEYGFEEEKDYCTKMFDRSDGLPGKPRTDHNLTLGMAKEICMLQRTEIGRKVRQYLIQVEEAWNDPSTLMARALRLADKKILRLTEKIERDKPKVLFADAVETAKTSILVGEMAKILKQNGVDIGQNRFFEWLRENGYLIRRNGTDYNMPTQYSMERGFFEIKETSVVHSDGHTSVNKTPKVTGRGQTYFVSQFLSVTPNDLFATEKKEKGARQ